MTTQVQIRGNTQTTQEARTLVSRELDVNTTDNRLCVHNGSRAGGIPHVNCYDQQNSEFNYASVTGTNALVGSVRVVPNGYIEGASYIIKISATNTGSVTLNLNSLGAKTLKKMNNGVLSNLDAGDLISGMITQVFYDGTHFQLIRIGTQKTQWTPNFVANTGSIVSSSFTATDCIYVDNGDSVTVSFGFVVTMSSGDETFKVDNLPFNSETTGAVTIKQGAISAVVFLGGNILDGFDGGASERGYNGVFTYIKD